MILFFKDIASTFLMPLPIFFLLLVISLITGFIKFKRTSKTLLIISLVYLFIISTPTIPWLLIEILENNYPSVNVNDTLYKSGGNNTHIVVFGLGHTDDKQLPDIAKIPRNQLGRVAEGIRIHKAIPGSKLILLSVEPENKKTEAYIMRNAVLSLGVDSSDVFQVTNATTTYEEALQYCNTFGKSKRVFLVTEASSMPRAMNFFHKLGMHPIPAPTNFYNKPTGTMLRFGLMPGVENIQKCNEAFHEYVGLLWQSLGGV